MAKLPHPQTRRTNRDAARQTRPPTSPTSPTNPARPRRCYTLSPQGLASLQASARRVKPWEQSTGPRTPLGKARSRMNAWKHGERSCEVMEQRALQAELRRLVRGVYDPGTPVP